MNSLFTLCELKRRIKALKPTLKKTCQKPRNHFRYPKWTPGLKYTLLKKATHSFKSLTHIKQTFGQNRLNCNHLAIYQHVDGQVDRKDRMEPRYAAVFTLENGSMVQPLQRHYKQCYYNSGRKDLSRAYDILKDKTPYWCCLYAARLKSERQSKKRYTQRKSRQK